MAEFARVAGGLGRRRENDFYPTRPLVVERFLTVERPPRGPIWDPCCGTGRLSGALLDAGRKVVSTDLHRPPYGEWALGGRNRGTNGVDFLTAPKPVHVRSIVANPPFSLAVEFVLRAIELKLPYHAWFLRWQFAEGADRAERLFRPHPPARVWVFPDRVQANALHEGDRGGMICWSWWVWDATAPPGPPQLGWLFP